MSYLVTVCGRAETRRCDCAGTASRLFRRFHQRPARRTFRRPCRRIIPRVLVHLGQLRGVIYSAAKGPDCRPRTYVHFMETPPLLACDPQGTQLYVIGGRYRVSGRGIEG